MASEENSNSVILYSSKAHVFQIDPPFDTTEKRTWVPKGEHAISISFVASIISQNSSNEPVRRELKIIGTDDNGETVLDAVILAKTTFIKRTVKFGQWEDHTHIVYGLGFNSENELTEFAETFQQLQRDILSPPSRPQPQHQQVHPMSAGDLQSQMMSQNDRAARTQQVNNNNNQSETNGRHLAGSANNNNNLQQQYSNTLAHPGHQHQQMKRQQQQQQQQPFMGSNGNTSVNNGNSGDISASGYSRSQSMLGLQAKAINNNNNNSVGNDASFARKPSPDNDNSLMSHPDWPSREQLRYENERLKQALEESSKNSGIWHNELLNLRTNNVKLTQALQESKAHVEEWERELLNLRDENKELKMQIMAAESGNNQDTDNQKSLLKYKTYINEVQCQLKKKENEIDELQKHMQELELRANGSAQNGQTDESQNAINANQKKKLDIINAKLEAKVNELSRVQKDFEQLVYELNQ